MVYYVITQYINTVTNDLVISDEDKTLLIRFYKCVLVGVILDWLDAGMNYDLLSGAIRIHELFDDVSGQKAILRAAEELKKLPAPDPAASVTHWLPV